MNLAQQSPDGKHDSPATLQYISEPEDVETPVDAVSWANSKTASTANLSEEDVKSKSWVIEYHQLIGKCAHPPEYGLTGPLRAWAYDDYTEWRTPLDARDDLKLEGFSETAKEAKTRSKDGWGVETATRDTKESIVRGNESESGGGLLGRFK